MIDIEKYFYDYSTNADFERKVWEMSELDWEEFCEQPRAFQNAKSMSGFIDTVETVPFAQENIVDIINTITEYGNETVDINLFNGVTFYDENDLYGWMDDFWNEYHGVEDADFSTENVAVFMDFYIFESGLFTDFFKAEPWGDEQTFFNWMAQFAAEYMADNMFSFLKDEGEA